MYDASIAIFDCANSEFFVLMYGDIVLMLSPLKANI